MTMHEATKHGATAGDVSVYERGELGAVDIGARMRSGHIDIAEGDEHIVSLVRRHLAGHPGGATIVDIGSGSGVLCEMLAAALPAHRVVANDTARGNCARAAARLARFPNAGVFSEPFERWAQPADVFISWGSHHHLEHGYLAQIRALSKPGGRFIVGDEFCPEYLSPPELAGGRAWLVDGYLFTSEAELEAHRRTGALPAAVLAREEARRRALWPWYRYVIDRAIEAGDWEIALIELQISRDDLTTGFADEHKTSPLLLETELRDAGFELLSRRSIGDREPALQSFVIYEAAPRGEGR